MAGLSDLFKYAEVRSTAVVLVGFVVSTLVMLSHSSLFFKIACPVLFALLARFEAAGGKCRYQTNLKGKVALITGGNSGLGKGVALKLAAMNCHVVLACRDLTKGQQAAKQIQQSTSNLNVEVMQMDAACLDSVYRFAQAFLQKYDRLDFLLNNAGVFVPPYKQTMDGLELQFGTNFLAHFLLTNMLLPLLLKSGGRIVSMNSIGYMLHKDYVPFEEMANPGKENYQPYVSYAYSKLCLILFTKELHRRYHQQGISAFAVHPGTTQTNGFRFFSKPFRLLHGSPLALLLIKKLEEGIQPPLYCLIHPNARSGLCYTDCMPVTPSQEALDVKRAQELWAFAEKLVQQKTSYKIESNIFNNNNNITNKTTIVESKVNEQQRPIVTNEGKSS